MSNAKSSPTPIQTFEVNVVKSSSSQQYGGEKKNTPAKGKDKKASKQHETTQTQDPPIEHKPK